MQSAPQTVEGDSVRYHSQIDKERMCDGREDLSLRVEMLDLAQPHDRRLVQDLDREVERHVTLQRSTIWAGSQSRQDDLAKRASPCSSSWICVSFAPADQIQARRKDGPRVSSKSKSPILIPKSSPRHTRSGLLGGTTTCVVACWTCLC